MAAKQPHSRRVARSAVTGEFTTTKYAKDHPHTTVMENLPRPGYGLEHRPKNKK